MSALRESAGLIMLSRAHRHGSVLTEVVGEVPLLAGNLMHDTETAVPMREHGVRRICTLVSDP